MNIITLQRKSANYVKIVQISDLHFDKNTNFPSDKNSGDLYLTRLANAIHKEKPDVLCVTGDIADRAIAEQFKLKGDQFLNKKDNQLSYYDFLESLWLKAKSFCVEYICKQADVDNSAIFIIPGNHDYRLQGFLGNDPNAVNLFNKCFGDFFMNRKLQFENRGHETINVDFICLDSNLDAKEEDLATGSIPEKEMRKFLEFDDLAGVDQVNSITSFRVCLLHHHPLPVVPAEDYKELGNHVTFPERLKRTQKILTGPQTTLLKNAGAFLYAAIDSRVDLVLHGHDHQPWVSEISYPRANGNHRLIVAAAGKAVKGNDTRYTFNSAKLYRNSNIQVIHRTIENNLTDVDNTPPFPNYSDAQIREIRWKKTCDKLRGNPLEETDIEQMIFYGALRADRVARLIEINSVGNADITYIFDGLEPITDEPVRILPIYTYSSGSYFYPVGGEQARKKILGTTSKRYYSIAAQFEPSKKPGGNDVWVITFDPELRKGHPLSFEISYTVYNAFEFIKEQRRERAKEELIVKAESRYKEDRSRFSLDGFESVIRGARAIFPEQMSEMVILPSGYSLMDAPQVCVHDREQSTDDQELEYCSKWLQHIDSKGIISLTVDRPLPSLTYGIAWPLITKEEHDKKKYKPKSIRHVKKIAAKKVLSLDQRANDMLVGLRSEYSGSFRNKLKTPLMDYETELSLFIVQHEWQQQKGIGRTLKVTLNLYAHALSSNSLLRFPLSFYEGEGIVGQAFRSGKVIFDHSSGRSGLYKMLKEQVNPHEFLWATPLFARTSQDFQIDRENEDLRQKGFKGKINGDEQNEYAPFGVLCIGSYKQDSGLLQLLGMTDLDCITSKSFIDYVDGQFAPNVFNHLIN